MFRVQIAMLVIGGMLCFFGCQEWRLSGLSDANPSLITVSELEANGPGDNIHITLADYLLCEMAYVYEARENADTFTKVWVPIVPLGGEYHQQLMGVVDEEGNIQGDVPMPSDINVILRSSSIDNEAQMTRVASADTLNGMVVNTLESLGGEERRLLQESYPGVNFDNVYLIDHERKPTGAGVMFAQLGGGVLLILAAGGLFAVGRGQA